MSVDNKVIQGLWIGEGLSLLEQLSIKSFIANGHEYHLYAYDDIKNIPEGTIVKDANEILPESKVYKGKFLTNDEVYCGFADVFRIKLLLDKGGIWVDTDVVCLKHFDFEEDYVFSSEISPYNSTEKIVGISVIKSPKDSIFLKDVYSHCLEISKNNLILSSKAWLAYINKHSLDKYIKNFDVFCKISCGETDIFTQKKSKDMYEHDDGCYSAHLWNQIINLKKEKALLEDCISIKKKILLKSILDKNKIYPDDTLYGYWQGKYL